MGTGIVSEMIPCSVKRFIGGGWLVERSREGGPADTLVAELRCQERYDQEFRNEGGISGARSMKEDASC